MHNFSVNQKDYFLISVPGEPDLQATWEKLCNKMNLDFCEFSKFNIPDLKVGTLDTLVALSESLSKLDVYVEGVTKKICQYLFDMMQTTLEKVEKLLLISGNSNHNKSDGWKRTTLRRNPRILKKYQWDFAKFPIKQSLTSISDQIAKKITQIEGELKTRSSNFNELRSNIEVIEKKSTGSLLTRNLYDLVKKEHFVLDSDYLTTLLVVVPKIYSKDWLNTYEKLCDMLVPNSSQLIFEDADHCLFTVTLFHKVVDEFKHNARQNKFITRDFKFDEQQNFAQKDEITKLNLERQKAFGPLVRWLQVNFNEAYCSWIHVKALRLFVESVLRYGLPVNFQGVIIFPKIKNSKKIFNILNNLYQHLDSNLQFYSKKKDAIDILDVPSLSAFSQEDYHPFVCLKLSSKLIESG